MENAATRHMWRATGWPTDTGNSCAEPTALLRPATDSHVAAAAGHATPNATATGAATGTATAASTQAVSLANYVYQCAGKRVPKLSPDLTSTPSLQWEQQQLTLPAIAINMNLDNL